MKTGNIKKGEFLVRQLLDLATKEGEGSNAFRIFKTLEKYADLIVKAIANDTIQVLLKAFTNEDFTIDIDSQAFREKNVYGLRLGVMMALTRIMLDKNQFEDWEEITEENIRDAAHKQLMSLVKVAYKKEKTT
jgi:hypothetical protein